MPLDRATIAALREARHGDPFTVLGMQRRREGGLVVRAWLQDAEAVALVGSPLGEPQPMQRLAEGLFELELPECSEPFPYRYLLRQADGGEEERADPYACWLLLGEWDLDRFREGHHHHLGEILGAHQITVGDVPGVRFAVWAPTAERVSVVGDWNGFDGRWHPMRLRHPYGVWELFIPGLTAGRVYKYEIRARDGRLRMKADPVAWQAEVPPDTASVVAASSSHRWQDDAWLEARAARDHARTPLAIYEVHAGTWARDEHGERLGWLELARRLADHCEAMGFTHVEFLPLAQHPYEGSWGYQVTGQYAPNARHGAPDELRAAIDLLHGRGIGVIVDFVPGHFPKDDWALADFDGHPCYEYADPREGEHREWGTKIFNWRRPEVRNTLLAAALHWIREYHLDGLRVDAVSSMLYRDYDRRDGEWIANEHGDRGNLEAVSFLQELTSTVHAQFPGVLMIAEESTAWPGVTTPTTAGGLGFDLKWNMGWMHDTLRYLALDPVMRAGSHDVITFHQWYAYDERWVLPMSHDEVVHGKRSLLDKAPGDWWQRLAQLRLLQAWQVLVPGRPLLFQGGEFGQGREWDWQRPVDWDEAAQPERQGLMRCLATMLGLYRQHAALHQADDQREGFVWLDVENRAESLLGFIRRAPGSSDVLAICNFTPVPRPRYPVGVPYGGSWRVLANTDAADFGGSGTGPQAGTVIHPGGEQRGHWPATLTVDIPPLAAVVLLHEG